MFTLLRVPCAANQFVTFRVATRTSLFTSARLQALFPAHFNIRQKHSGSAPSPRSNATFATSIGKQFPVPCDSESPEHRKTRLGRLRWLGRPVGRLRCSKSPNGYRPWD